MKTQSKKQHTLSWETCASALEDIFRKVPCHLWISQEELEKTLVQALNIFPEKYKKLEEQIGFLSRHTDDSGFQTQETQKVMTLWAQNGEPPTMLALMFYALEMFEFDAQEDGLIIPCLVAAVLGEVKNNLAYHNNLHFCKVVFHTMRLIIAHNRIFKETRQLFDKSEIAMLLAAAAIHDIGHKGESNIIDRKYYSGKTELRSFDYAYPYLKAAGFYKSMLEDIRIMLHTTDASPFGDPISPSNQMRAAYEYHYGTSDSEEDLVLSDDLKILESREKLCLMCLILHEADIMNSSGVSYDVTKRESVSIAREIGMSNAMPEDTLLFLTLICGRGMVSDAAKFLAGTNFSNIYDDVLQDFRNGNKPYKA